jgi:hypothetical protein
MCKKEEVEASITPPKGFKLHTFLFFYLVLFILHVVGLNLIISQQGFNKKTFNPSFLLPYHGCHYEKSCPQQLNYLAIKAPKQLIYNYVIIIPCKYGEINK